MSDVSVVMCTYNGAGFVEEQLRSILDQTTPPAEIVVYDDRSTDATPDIVRRVGAGTDVPIRFSVNASRLGFADNFLAACRAATGTYIAFSDQDDRWMPRKLEAARTALVEYGACLCTHAVELIDAAGNVLSTPSGGAGATLLERPDPFGNFYGFTMTFERSLLNRIPADVRGLDPHSPGAPLSHDRWVYFLATTFGRTVVLDEPLAQYRQHAGQLYGGEQARGLGERIATKIAVGERQSAYLAAFAAHLADLLESSPPGVETDAWRSGAARWRRLHNRYTDRARFYGRSSAWARAATLLSSCSRRAYTEPSAGGLGHRRLLEDVAVALVSALPASRRPTPPTDHLKLESAR